MMLKLDPRILSNLQIAVEAVVANRIRSFLTALGIIFGVAAVIAMLSIGNGAQQEILDQIKLVGVNNIVVKPIIEQVEEDIVEEANSYTENKKHSSGLSLRDMQTIQKSLPGIQSISPEIILDTHIIKDGTRRSTKLVGVEPAYFEIFNFSLSSGKMFHGTHLRNGTAVCIIGKSVQSRFFPFENPIGRKLKCGSNWLTVIGVLDERFISSGSIGKLGIRDYNMDVYVPLQTLLIRYRNRSLLTESMMRASKDDNGKPSNPNYHQLDRLVVQIKDTKKLAASADIIARMLDRQHNGLIDFEIEIPELLLKQQQRTNDIFRYVLGAIAGIALIVGGIGIMNIMLASVLERIKEIGLRLSLGAKRSDIVFQFMFESMMISITGGLIGILLGALMAVTISSIADIPTIVSFNSVLIAFGVAVSVGLIFGISPARRAAEQDPITCLRYE